MDQAKTLRRLSRGLKPVKSAASTRVGLRGIAVASGKGGVGKTNFVANLAYELATLDQRVLVLDADMGLGNIHILLGFVPRRTLQHVISGDATMDDILIRTKYGFDVLPAGSGNRTYNNLAGEEMLTLKTELEVLEHNYDYILFDIGAGISSNVMYFCSAAEDTAILTSTEPTSFADAYAIMKVLSKEYGKKEFKLIVNSVKSEQEGANVFGRLSQVSDRFGLNIRIDYLGHIYHDEMVQRAVREQSLFAEKYPGTKAAKCIANIAGQLVQNAKPAELSWGKIFA